MRLYHLIVCPWGALVNDLEWIIVSVERFPAGYETARPNRGSPPWLRRQSSLVLEPSRSVFGAQGENK